MKRGSESRRWLRPLIEELERRLLLSADVESVLVDPSLGQPDSPRDPAAEVDLLRDDLAATEIASVARRELLFVDSGVAGHEQLVKDLLGGSADGRTLEVVLLDSGRDGVEQITEALARSRDVDAVHIVSHGSPGAVQLGSASLSAGTLDAYSDSLASWGNALAPEADILFYGCDLAGGESGAAFVDSLADLTGADVAASVDLTGSALLGGDWDLEYRSGAIETDLAFGAGVQQTWSATLAAPVAVLDDWTAGLTHSVSAGSDRLLVFVVSAESSAMPIGSVTGVTWGGQALTKLTDAVENNGVAENRIEVWYLDESGISAATGNTFAITGWSGNDPGSELYDAVTLQNVDQASPFGDVATGNALLSSSVQLDSAVEAFDGDFVFYSAATGGLTPGGDTNTVTHQPAPGYTEAHEQNDLAQGHLLSQGTQQISANGSEQPTASFTGGTQNRLVMIGAVVRQAGRPLANDQSFAVDENAAAGTAVGTVVASDSDVGDTLSYSITGGNTGGAFAIDPATGEITVADGALLDRETNPRYSLTVQVQDDSADSLIDTAAVTIDLNDVNDAPVVDDQSFSVDENSAAGTLVGTVVASDPEASLNKIYWADFDTGKIQRASPDGSNVEDLVTGLMGPRDIVIDDVAGEIYWVDGTAGKVQRANLDGTAIEDLVTGLGDPGRIALDLSGGKIYWTEDAFGAAKIQRANLDGSNVEALVTFGLSEPRGIALDVAGGKMYWSDAATGKIQRANLDGSSVQDLVTGLPGPMSVAIDLSAGKIYWADYAGNRIQRANLNGSSVENVVTGLIDPNGITIDSVNGKIYWGDPGSGKIQRANLDGSGVEDLITSGLANPIGIQLDLRQSLTYSIVGGNTGNAFAIDPATGEITVATPAALNFETTPTFSLTVQVTDDGTPSESDTAIVTISLNDLDEAPVIDDATFAVDENSPDGTAVGSVPVVEPDANDTYSYAIVAGDPGGAFAIDNAGNLTVADGSQLDFESQSSYTLTVQVTDDDAESDTATVTVNLNDVNDAPTISLPGGPVNFSEGDGPTVIDAAATVSDVDSPDFGGGTLTVEFTANATANDRLAIDSNGGPGNISINGSNVRYNFGSGPVTIGTFSGGTDGFTQLIVTLNTNADQVAVETLLRSITYENVSPNPSTASRTVQFVLTDGDGGTSDPETETINVSPANTAPQLTIANPNLSYAENDPPLAIDAGLTLTDPDDTDLVGATVTITAGFAVGEDELLFTAQPGITGSFDPATGILTLTGTSSVANYEAALRSVTYRNTSDGPDTTQRTVTIVVDDGFDTASDSRKIDITAVNDAPTLGDGTLAPVVEDTVSPPGQTVSTIFSGQFSDPDSGSSLAGIAVVGNSASAASEGVWQYSTNGGANWFDIGVVGDGATALALDSATLVRFVPVGDFNGSPTALVVRGLDDSYGGNFSSTAGNETRVNVDTTTSGGTTPIAGATSNISTSITPQNDAPVVSDQTLGPVAENTGAGTLVGTVVASDVDAGQSLSYAITGGNTGNAFAIDPTTGEITVATPAALDFETTPSFSLTVQVTDNGTPSLSDSATVTIGVSNVDEVPVIDDATFAVDENAANGAAVGSVPVAVPDPNDTYTFDITSGDPGGAFAIDNAGNLTVADGSRLNFESQNTYALTVRVTDDDGSSDTANVTVNLNDLDEAPLLADAIFTVDENAANGTLAGTVPVEEPDANDTYSYGIVAGDPGGAFAIDDNGNITVADGSQLDFESQSSYTLSVRVSDDDGFTDVATITIGVNDVVESPTVVVDSIPDPNPEDGEPETEDFDPPAEDPPEPEPEETRPDEPADEPPPSVPVGFQEPPEGRFRPTAPTFTAPHSTSFATSETDSGEEPFGQQTSLDLSDRIELEPARIGLELAGNERMMQALDRIRQEMTDDARQLADEHQITVSAAEGFALMLSLGWLGLLLRGGSLAAIALSSLPMWRRVDPLAVLAISEEERLRREQDLQNARKLEDQTDTGVGNLLDDSIARRDDGSEEVPGRRPAVPTQDSRL